MNNIEILEEFIKYFEAEATQRKYRRNISITVGEDDIEAIENLIQDYKELKENPPIIFKNAEIKIGDEQINKYIGKNYILKSKEKEKIEELDKRIDYLNKELEKLQWERDYYKLRFEELNKNWYTVIHELLGKDYYNYGCDWKACNDLTTEDLIYKYKKRWWQFWRKN